MKLTGTDPVVGRERVGRLSLLMRCYGDLGIPRVVLSVACRHASAGCCPLRVGHGHGWNQNLGKLWANASSRIKQRFFG